jgi:RNA polymerase sigma-B factor
VADEPLPGDLRFEEYRRAPTQDLRNELIEDHLNLARAFARRFAHRGVSVEDLEQVARLGLLHAVDRFDPELGAKFTTFAGRTIDGELKRHFRDRAWSVRVPRRSQELGIAVRGAMGELAQSLGRSPTPGELAQRVGATTDEVLEAIEASSAFRADSLDAPRDTELGPLTETLQTDDLAFDALVNEDLVGRLLAGLSERERVIVRLRFFEELSQGEIARRVGVSQMHVSRLLRKALAHMRDRGEQHGS